jgi:STAM-binding protein
VVIIGTPVVPSTFMTTYHDPNAISRTSSGSQGSPRPRTIAELAERALSDLWDPSRDLKYWLRTAQKYRNDGKQYADEGDYENAFIHFAKAATIVLEKLPTHRDYHDVLNVSQRHNLGLVSNPLLR